MCAILKIRIPYLGHPAVLVAVKSGHKQGARFHDANKIVFSKLTRCACQSKNIVKTILNVVFSQRSSCLKTRNKKFSILSKDDFKSSLFSADQLRLSFKSRNKEFSRNKDDLKSRLFFADQILIVCQSKDNKLHTHSPKVKTFFSFTPKS